VEVVALNVGASFGKKRGLERRVLFLEGFLESLLSGSENNVTELIVLC